jgi:hypothetical protein
VCSSDPVDTLVVSLATAIVDCRRARDVQAALTAHRALGELLAADELRAGQYLLEALAATPRARNVHEPEGEER